MKNKNKKINRITVIALALLVAGSVLFNSTIALASEITPENLAYLINIQRSYYGLKPLKIDTDLSRAASLKSRDMLNRDYFEHFAYGLAPWDFIRNAGYEYLYAGENLAMGFKTSEGTVKAWMNSPAHRANILNPDYEDMGVGVVKGTYTKTNGKTVETTMVTNMFGRKKPMIVEVFNKIVDGLKNIFSF